MLRAEPSRRGCVGAPAAALVTGSPSGVKAAGGPGTRELQHVGARKGAFRLPPAVPVLADSKLRLSQKPREEREQDDPGVQGCGASPRLPLLTARGPCSTRGCT